MFVHTGDYFEHTSNDTLRSTYYTFTPVPLMEGSFYSMNDELSALLTDAYRSLGVLEGMAEFIPDKEILSNLMLLRESSFSKMIDNPDFDMLTLLTKRVSSSSYGGIQNIMSGYHYAIETATPKLNLNNIVNFALHGDDQKQRISTRTTPMFLSKITSSFRQYNPTAPEKIQAALFDIIQYMESSNSDILIKAAMCHYQFEMIHPYECYNGISGRILFYHMMNNTNLHGARLLCLSASLYRHKVEYFDRLTSAQKNGNYTSWIDFFIRIIIEAADESIALIRRYNECTSNDEKRVLSHCKDKRDSTPEVYQFFKHNIVSDIGRINKRLGLSYAAASRSVSILQDFGIVTQINRNSRNRLFAYDSILQHLTTLD
jgi:hypothetical protein